MKPNQIDPYTPVAGSFLLMVFVLCAAVATPAQTFSVIYTFNNPGPIAPASGVSIDAAGNLYGTSLGYGHNDYGVVYRLSPRNGGWTASTLFPFDFSNGNTPVARPVFGPDGRLYGTTVYGGFGCDYGCGNVYSLQPPTTFCRTALCYWTGASAYNFDSIPDDGAYPLYGDLLFDAAGNIYGTTSSNVPFYNLYYGTVFELSNSHGVWSESILHQFGSGNDGVAPGSGVIRDQNGNLYGTTAEGGAYTTCNSGRGCGTIYELGRSGSGWNEQILYSFQGGDDGDTPIGGLVMDAAGNLYGTTASDGANGGGTVFELSPSNGAWNLTTIHSFPHTGDPATDCSGQNGTLLLDSSGNLYGTTCTNGAYGYGAVFKLAKSNGSWGYTSLHDFSNGDDGANPIGTPSFDRNGNLYGTASRGGPFLYGTAWKVTP